MSFVDTGARVALLDPRDLFHERFVRFQKEVRQAAHGRLVTRPVLRTYRRDRGDALPWGRPRSLARRTLSNSVGTRGVA